MSNANSLVTLIKGDSTTILNTQILDGQILFDETNKIIYMDDNSTRTQFSISPDMIDDIAFLETGTKATRGYSKGQYVWVNNILYKTKTQINSGTTFTVGTIIEAETIGAALTRLGNLNGADIKTSVSKTGSGTTVTNTISSGTTLNNAVGTLLNNDYALKSALDTASNKITALEASELFETRIAINCNTSVSGITPFGYKGTSLPISSDTTSKIYSVTIEKPSSGEWVFSVDVNQTDRTVTVYANGSTIVYAEIAYHR